MIGAPVALLRISWIRMYPSESPWAAVGTKNFRLTFRPLICTGRKTNCLPSAPTSEQSAGSVRYWLPSTSRRYAWLYAPPPAGDEYTPDSRTEAGSYSMPLMSANPLKTKTL